MLNAFSLHVNCVVLKCITFSKKCKCFYMICRCWKQKCSHKNLCAPRLCAGVRNCVEGDTPMRAISRNGSGPYRNNGSSLGIKLQTGKTDCMQPVLSNRFELLILQQTGRCTPTKMHFTNVLYMFYACIHTVCYIPYSILLMQQRQTPGLMTTSPF